MFPSRVQVQISTQCSAVRCFPGCVSETQSSGRFPFLAHVSVFCSALFLSDFSDPAAVIFLNFFLSSDLDHFKVHTRSAVSVREGQGVVLLCGTPTSSGGELSGPSPCTVIKDDFSLN